jgi:hypothetical protein
MRWLRNWWWARQRAIDMQILWPTCKKQAVDLDHAKAAFAMHAFADPAWVRFYEGRLFDVIDKLE